VPGDVSSRTNLAPFVAIDLAPTTLNGHVYRLSTRVVSDGRPGKTHGHFEANYSGCTLFHATVTIEPNVHTVPDDTKPTLPRSLVVESQQVVVIERGSADGWRQAKTTMGSMPVVLVQPWAELLASFV
jgi:hypothetical protein